MQNVNEWLEFFITEGASIIPLRKNEKKPAVKWKRYTEEKMSLEQLKEIQAKDGSINYAVICGVVSNNLVVIDIDNAELFEKLSLGELAAETLTVQTSKGFHLYLRFDSTEVEALNAWIGKRGVKSLAVPAPKKAEGTEAKSQEEIRFQWNNHYVVGPGSIHPSGVRYTHFVTSPKRINTCKGIGLLEEIERRWQSYRGIQKRGETVLEEPLLEFIKRYIAPERVVDCGEYIQMRSPFHRGTSPNAFTIYKQDNHWYDFSEERGGRHAEFLMRLKGITKEQAYDELGITTPKPKRGGSYRTSAWLSDGRYIEEILQDGTEMFVLYNPADDSWNYVTEVFDGDSRLLPLPLPVEQQQSITLPDGVEEYDDLKNLREEMRSFALEEFDPVDNIDLFELIVQLELVSWIAAQRMKKLSEQFIPILTARGPSETGKKRFLTIARWLTYRPLYALKTTRVPTLFRALSPWGGTLILDEADLADTSEKSEFIEFMNSRADGVPIPRYNAGAKEVEYFHSFGMSIIAERSSSADDGYESRKIIFPSESTSSPERYSLIPPKQWTEKGKELQRKLLLFRLRHLEGDVPTNILLPGIKGFRVRESLLLLESLADEDSDITTNLATIAKKLEERLIQERSSSMEGLIINIVYNWIIDDTTTINPYHDGLEIRYEYTTKGEKKRTPVKLKTISNAMGEVMTPSEIARRWRGLGQSVRARGRIDGTLHSGIIQITNVNRFIKESGKYILDINYSELNDRLLLQTKL